MNHFPRRITHFLLALIGLMFWTSCGSDARKEDLDKIKKQEGKADALRKENAGKPAEDVYPFQELAISYIDFVDKYPEDPQSPDFLFKAAEIYAHDVNDLPRALQIFTRNYTEYPQHPTGAVALFTKAYLYNNVLKNYVYAEKAYKEFLEKYPTHAFAADARNELENLGLSDEEMLNRIQQKNHSADSVRK